MNSMLKRLMHAAAALMVILSGGISAFIWISAAGTSIKVAVTLFAASMIFVSGTFFWLVSRQINSALQALSETIQSMIDDNTVEKLHGLDDTLLSKLQGQIFKLSDILKSHSMRQKTEKENITSLISDISHQLKTPLTNLNMYNSFLMEKDLPEGKRNEFMQNVKNQLEKLGWLMDSLIKMSRLEAGIVNLNLGTNAIEQTVLQAINMVSLKAEQKNIDLAFKGDGSIYVNHDTGWTQEAIFNILDNAVKYSPSNSLISVSLAKYELFCRIDIADNGGGIHECDIGRIFSRFYRGENSKNSEGAGIGLFLSRKIITEQGGYIKVKSVLGEGAVFSVFLPVHI